MRDTIDNLAEVLDADLARLNMSQRDLAFKLNQGDDAPISEAGISNWKRVKKIPPRRVKAIIEILGPNSLTAQAIRDMLAEHERMLAPNALKRLVDHSPVRKPLRELVRECADGLAIPNFDCALHVNGRTLRYDYATPKLVCQFMRMPDSSPLSMSPGWLSNLVKLLLCKSEDKRASVVRDYLIVVMFYGSQGPYQLRPWDDRVISDARFLGIDAAVTTSPSGAWDVVKSRSDTQYPTENDGYDAE